MKKYNKIYTFIITIVFLLYIGIICFANIITPDKIFSESENRMLEQLPKFSVKQLIKKKFTTSYETYVSDQFAFRDFWIGIKSSTERAIGKKENNDVYLGKNGYLLQKFPIPKDTDMKQRLNSINSFAVSNPSLNKYILLAPTATKILEANLPSYAKDGDELLYINKVKNSLDPSIKFVNLYNYLQSKNQEYIYYKTDHHWTTDGAFYAYEQLGIEMNFIPHDKNYYNVEKVTDNFYGSLYSESGFRNIKPDTIKLYLPKVEKPYKIEYSDTHKTSNSFYKMANLNVKDKYTVFLDGNHPLLKISTNIKPEKKLLVIKDSYANSLLPFLADHFSEIYVVDLRYYSDDISTLISTNHINNILFLYNITTFFDDDSINNISP